MPLQCSVPVAKCPCNHPSYKSYLIATPLSRRVLSVFQKKKSLRMSPPPSPPTSPVSSPPKSHSYSGDNGARKLGSRLPRPPTRLNVPQQSCSFVVLGNHALIADGATVSFPPILAPFFEESRIHAADSPLGCLSKVMALDGSSCVWLMEEVEISFPACGARFSVCCILIGFVVVLNSCLITVCFPNSIPI